MFSPINKSVWVIFLLLCVFYNGYSQSLAIDWVIDSGAPVEKTIVDNEGNIYAAGSFYGIVGFDPNGNVVNLTGNSFSNKKSVFITKYSDNGVLIWAKKLHSSGNRTAISSLRLINNNLFITGTFKGTVNFDSGNTDYSLTTTNALYMARYNLDGGLVWVGKIDGATNGSSYGDDFEGFFESRYSGDMSFNSYDNSIYLYGSYDDTVDFDFTENVLNKTAIGYRDMFLAKYAIDGTLIWCKTSGHENSRSSANAISTDESGNIYVGGFFESENFDFDFSDNEFMLSSGTYYSNGYYYPNSVVYLAKYDSNLNLIFARTYDLGYTFSHIKDLYFHQNKLYMNTKVASQFILGDIISKSILVATDESGDILWSEDRVTNGNSVNYPPAIMDLKISPGNKILIVGNELDGKPFLANYNNDGSINYGASNLSSRIFDLTGDSIGNIKTICLSNSNPILTGSIYGPTQIDLDIDDTEEYWIGYPEFRNFIVKYIDIPLSTSDYNIDKEGLTIYPNPSTSSIYITSFSKSIKNNLYVYDVLGKLVYQKRVNITLNNYALDISFLNSGVYFLEVTNGYNSIKEKIVKH